MESLVKDQASAQHKSFSRNLLLKNYILKKGREIEARRLRLVILKL